MLRPFLEMPPWQRNVWSGTWWEEGFSLGIYRKDMEKHGMEFLINVIWTLGFLGTSDSFGDLYRSNTDIYI